MKKLASLISLVFALPAVAFAQTGSLQPIQTLLVSIGNLVSLAIPILIGVAMVVFFWGIVQYIRKPEAAEGKKIMIAGIVSLFVMVSIWGIITLAQQALFNGTPGNQINAPHFPQN